MAKLSKEQWQAARDKWEADKRDGFAWLATELGVSRQTINVRAVKEGWAKRVGEAINLPAEKTAQHKKSALKNCSKTAQNLPDDSGEAIHGNSLYQPEYADWAYKFCLLGATDAELAANFDVSEQTINNWKKLYPDFLESILNGKDRADANVAESLYKRAMGYSHVETKVFCSEGEIVTYDVDKHYPPDTRAVFLWLKNRQSGKWKDKQEVEHNYKLDAELLEIVKTQYIERMDKARQRQLLVYQERKLGSD